MSDKTTKSSRPGGEVPSAEDVLAYLRSLGEPVGRREIVQHFRLKGRQRERLIEILDALMDRGAIVRGERRRYRPAGVLPEIGVVEVVDRDADGEFLGRPVPWTEPGAPPTVYVAPDRPGLPVLHVGLRLMARFKRLEPGIFEADPIRVVGPAPKEFLGFYANGGPQGRVTPVDKRDRRDYLLNPADAGDAEPGELVRVVFKRAQHATRGTTGPPVRVVERLARSDSPQAVSLIAIYEYDLPVAFSDGALAEAEAAGPVAPEGREDLRDLPLVTIDGPDAKDFDDAVWAAPDDSPDNPGGFQIVVAIADVAHYVRPGSALDKAARERGNSVYFPDRVVPMLPEALSNGWCSLRPDETRGCLAACLRIDRNGRLLSGRFTRGLMRSRARLTYTQVQDARDGRPDAATAPLLDSVIAPLYGAFAALLRDRERRGTLDIDLPEKEMELDERGQVVGIHNRQRRDSHRLIEELMICANVAAARRLEELGQPCVYRIHESPQPERVEALRQTLASFGLTLAPDQAGSAQGFQRVLAAVRDRPEAQIVTELVLRSQQQARYSPENHGHFGLGLARYAHFTSPIRRYADLLIHRALVSGLKAGPDGLDPDTAARLDEVAEHISGTERRAQAAEYAALDRYAAAFLKDRIGASFEGRVTGVTRFGLFVSLSETGADGLIPIRTLPQDYYHHDATQHCLIGQNTGDVYRLGDTLRVRLAEANPITGGISLRLDEVIAQAPVLERPGAPARPGGPPARKPRQDKPGSPAAGKGKAKKPGKKGKAGAKAKKDKPGKAAKRRT